jgi:uncharacterized protein YxeA
MKKFIYTILLLIVLTITSARDIYAENIAATSAILRIDAAESDFDYRVENLKKFFERYNSPLTSYAEEFVTYADEYNLDYRLVPAITGVESTFGKRIPTDSYNAYGWANGEYQFSSWEDSIQHVSEVLKSSYIDRGVVSIHQIARVYAPPSVTWGGNVTFFVKKIDTLPLDFDII